MHPYCQLQGRARDRRQTAISLLFYSGVALETLALSTALPNAFTVPKVIALLLGAAFVAPVVIQSIHRIPKVLMLQFAAVTAATVFSLNPQVSFWGADWRRMGLLTWAAILITAAAVPIVIDANRARWTQFLRFIAATGFIAAGYGVLQWLDLDPLLPTVVRGNLIREFGGVYRAIGTIGQPTYFANYLQYPLFCALALLRFDSHRWWRRFSGICIGVVATAILVTMSRGAILGAAAGFIILGVTTMNRRRFIVAGALIVVITVGSAGLLLSTPHYGNQLQARLDYIWKDATGGGRLVLWHDVVLRLLPNVWLRGTGLGMFRPAFAAHRSDNYSAFNPDVHFETAHNIFLDRWTEQGLPGLVILVVLIAITIQNNRKSFRHTSEASQRWAITAVTCALVSACIGNLFNGEVIPTAYYLYLWIGLSFATRDCFMPFVVPQYASRSLRLPAYAVSAVLPCVLVWHANNNWIAEKNLSAALKALHAGNETDLVRFGRASVAAFPEKGVYGLEFSNLVLEFVNTHPLRDPQRRDLAQVGIEYGLKATAGDKSMLAYYYVSELGNAINDPRTGMWVKHLISIDPFWFRPHRLLASRALLRRQVSIAETEAQSAQHLAPYDSATLSLNRSLKELSDDKTVKVIEAYGRLPLTFEANHGQLDSGVDFLARTRDYSILTKRTEAVFAGRSLDNSKAEVVRMRLTGADAKAIALGLDEQPGRSNYFIGKDPSKWQTDIPSFGKIAYRSIYPGIDLIYYGNQQQLEYDFVVESGADPSKIELGFEGDVEAISEDSSGNLNIRMPSGDLKFQRPHTYQQLSSGKREVASSYVVEKGLVRFRLGAYDKTQPLIIDPVLMYSTYLGGSGNEWGYSVAVDASGNAFIVGQTDALPLSNPPVGSAFVMKLNPSGSALLYSAVFAGNNDAAAYGIGVDASGSVYVVGDTTATDFPVTAGAFQSSIGGGRDVFFAKIAFPSGSIMYSTYLGGAGNDFAAGLAVDATGVAVITGTAQSTNFPTVNAIQSSLHGPSDAFIAKFSPDGTPVYSTYWGGNADENGDAIAMDASGNAYVTGQTGLTGYPVVNAIQSTPGGNYDAFVLKLDASGTSVVYSTLLGGTNLDFGAGIAADTSGNAYVTGLTASPNFPATNPQQAGVEGCFIVKISSDGANLLYATRFATGAWGFGIALDASANTYITGRINSMDTMVDPLQSTLHGGQDAFLAKLNSSGVVVFSTYLGGSGVENGYGIAVDASGSAYIVGNTESADFPVAAALQPTLSGGVDAFITKIGTAVVRKRQGQITSQ